MTTVASGRPSAATATVLVYWLVTVIGADVVPGRPGAATWPAATQRAERLPPALRVLLRLAVGAEHQREHLAGVAEHAAVGIDDGDLQPGGAEVDGDDVPAHVAARLRLEVTGCVAEIAGEVAGHLVVGAIRGDEQRLLLGAALLGPPAAGAEAAALGGSIGLGSSPDSTIRRRVSCTVGIGDRHRRQQRLGVRVLGLSYTSSAAPISTILPRYITATRSAIWRTTARSWAMKMYDSPSRSRRSASRRTISAWMLTSSADTGSSSTSSAGEIARARAMPTRWRCPPENSCG